MDSPVLLDEKHELISFDIAPEPVDWRKPGIRLVRTHTRKPTEDTLRPAVFKGGMAVSLVIDFSARQLFAATLQVCEIKTKSEFVFSTPKQDLPDDFWCDLFEKSVLALIGYYTSKTKGTYLEKQPLNIPANIREDCMKQRKIDRNSLNN